jgi:hypothetical protein
VETDEMSEHRKLLANGSLTLVAVLLAVLASSSGAALASEPATEKFEKSFDLTGITRVRLQNVNGPVRVLSWEKDLFRLEAIKKARGSRMEQNLRETEIRITQHGGTIDVETILPKRSRWYGFFAFGDTRGAEVSYELRLPPAVAVEIETVNGRILAEKRTGTLALNTVNGSVRVEAHDAPLRVNTVNGSVDVAFLGSLKPADLETVNGSVIVACSRLSSIRYQLQTVNGRIRSDFEGLTVEGKWGPREAKGTLNGGKDRLSVETVNGEIRLVCPDEKAAPARTP